MSNLTIRLKLWILTGIAAIGFLVVGVMVSNQLSSLKIQYEESKSINSSLSALKSMLIGGLMVNSAANVYFIDPINPKPLKTIKNGIEKLDKFSKKLKKVSTKHYNSMQNELNTFSIVSNNILKKANKEHIISYEDSKNLLKPWRALKSKIRALTPIFKKTGAKAQKKFYRVV